MKENTKIALVIALVSAVVVFLVIRLTNEQKETRSKTQATIIKCETKTNDLPWCLENFNL